MDLRVYHAENHELNGEKAHYKSCLIAEKQYYDEDDWSSVGSSVSAIKSENGRRGTNKSGRAEKKARNYLW